MDFMDIYTPYTLFFVICLNLSIMLSALLNAYIIVNARKSFLLVGHLLTQTGFILWLFGKLMEFVSPTIEIKTIYILIQHGTFILLFIGLSIFYKALVETDVIKRISIRLYLIGGILLLNMIVVFFPVSKFWLDFEPIFCFWLWTINIFIERRQIFAELSTVSLEIFMDSIDDAVIIFDRYGKLLDLNTNAKNLFREFLIRNTLDEFMNAVNSHILFDQALLTINEQKSREIGINCPLGSRYFIYSMTLPRNKRDETIAIVLTFHDITDKKVILAELDEKNTEFEKLNQQLHNYILAAIHLEEEKEKNRTALQVQETIGQSIIELLAGLEVLKLAKENDRKEIEQKLSEMIANCRQVLLEVRISVEKLMSQKPERK